jgi:hypothetical protein
VGISGLGNFFFSNSGNVPDILLVKMLFLEGREAPDFALRSVGTELLG